MMRRPQCLLITTLTLRASIDTMFGDLADALRRRGVHTRIYAEAPQAPNLGLLHGLIGDLRDYDGPRFIIDVNGKSSFMVDGADGVPRSIHDAWDIPCISMFESNPVHHLQHLAQAPRNVAFTVVDADHLAAFEAFDVPCRGQAFVPHAGPPPLDWVLPARDRAIPVLFIGNVGASLPVSDWLAALSCDPAMKPAARRTIEACWAERIGAYASLTGNLTLDGIALDRRRDLRLACAIETYINAAKRAQSLSAIKGHEVVVCGEIHASLPNSERIRAIGPTSFVKSLQLMDNAEIVLNFAPFRTGAHERVFYGLGRGAYSLSDYSTLLAPAADAGAGLSFLPDRPDDLDQVIAQIRAGTLDEAVAAGRAWYAQAHTWDHRAGTVLDLVSPLLDSAGRR